MTPPATDPPPAFRPGPYLAVGLIGVTLMVVAVVGLKLLVIDHPVATGAVVGGLAVGTLVVGSRSARRPRP